MPPSDRLSARVVAHYFRHRPGGRGAELVVDASPEESTMPMPPSARPVDPTVIDYFLTRLAPDAEPQAAPDPATRALGSENASSRPARAAHPYRGEIPRPRPWLVVVSDRAIPLEVSFGKTDGSWPGRKCVVHAPYLGHMPGAFTGSGIIEEEALQAAVLRLQERLWRDGVPHVVLAPNVPTYQEAAEPWVRAARETAQADGEAAGRNVGWREGYREGFDAGVAEYRQRLADGAGDLALAGHRAHVTRESCTALDLAAFVEALAALRPSLSAGTPTPGADRPPPGFVARGMLAGMDVGEVRGADQMAAAVVAVAAAADTVAVMVRALKDASGHTPSAEEVAVVQDTIRKIVERARERVRAAAQKVEMPEPPAPSPRGTHRVA